MGVRTQSTDSPSSTQRADTQRLYELLRAMRDDIKQIKERLERLDKPINSGKDL